MNAFKYLEVVKASVETIPYTTHLVFASPVSAQYVVLSAPSFGDSPEEPLAVLDRASAFDFRVKAVTGTPDGVAIMLDRIRELLSPDRVPTKFPGPDSTLYVRFIRSEFIDVDESTTTPATNRHPAFGVDTYQITAEPT